LPRSPTSQNQRHDGPPPLSTERLPRERFSPPTHCCPWPFSERATGLLWNLTFADIAEQRGDGVQRFSLKNSIIRRVESFVASASYLYTLRSPVGVVIV
jgi:hypothetical protein